MPDFTQYQPPDIYIEEEPTPIVSVIGVTPTVVAIVGPGVGYRTFNEAVMLVGTTAVTLSRLGIDTTSIVVRDASGAVIGSAQYAAVVGPGEDADALATEDNTTTLARVVGSTIPDGDVVYVSYHYTDVTYAQPQRFRSYEDVVDAFGEGLDVNTSVIVSPLSLAAKIAFDNGANQVVLVPAGTASAVTRTELSDAMALLDAAFDVNVVVPLPVGITGTTLAPGDTANVATDLLTHLETAQANRIFRMGILGYERTVTVPPETSVAGMRSKRAILAWPNRMSYYNGYANQEIEVAGYYLAAAIAGGMAAREVAMPLTRKQVRGFSGIPGSVVNTMTTSYKNELSDLGVTVVEKMPNDGRLVIRHGVTTDRTNIHNREVSLVRTKDALVNLVRATFERSGLIGSYVDDDTLANVKSVTDGVLMSAKRNKVIRNYQPPNVRQQSIDPTVIEVKFQYDPLYPLNYIVVAFSINTVTGEVAPIENVAA